MSIRYIVDPQRQRIEVTLAGEVSLEEMLQAIRDSVADPLFEPGFDVLSDHTKLSQPLAPGDVPLVMQQLRSLSAQMAGARWAAITSSSASFGMMRLLGVYAEEVPMEIRAFTDAAEAESWLSSGRGAR